MVNGITLFGLTESEVEKRRGASKSRVVRHKDLTCEFFFGGHFFFP
jgi:hypothetical protein